MQEKGNATILVLLLVVKSFESLEAMVGYSRICSIR